MNLSSVAKGLSAEQGEAMMALVRDLYPLCRSITGDGLRATLRLLQQHVPLEIREVPSGTPVFDWTVPNEWNIRDAYIEDAQGARVVDFRAHNLHVVNYSVPVRERLTLEALRPHLHTLPEHPDWIPYRTSYYRETWGFCLRHSTLLSLEEGEYEVVIDSSLEPGSLSFGELVLPGKSGDEVLFSAHCCHPSLANDNLSGIAVAILLAQLLAGTGSHHYTYRFLFVPATIGTIAWLSLNEAHLSHIEHGLVLAGVGDGGPLHFKRSRRGDSELDRAAAHVLSQRADTYTLPFSPDGYDERQYGSPGINLPVGRLSRTPYGTYPEYHTSADNPSFISEASLVETLAWCLELVDVLEHNGRYRNLAPKGEPQLGKRGLYTHPDGRPTDMPALLWVLNLSDGKHTLLEVAERSGLAFGRVKEAADLLLRHDLLQRVD